MRDDDIVRVSRRLLRPYVIPDDCPYLSEDQRELSTLTIEGRSAWMAEWLALAESVRDVRVPSARPTSFAEATEAGRSLGEGRPKPIDEAKPEGAEPDSFF